MAPYDESRERFRKGFVLGMTVAYTIVFVAMIGGFVIPLLLAAVFSGIVYPLFVRIEGALGGRAGLASGLTLLIVLVAIVAPLVLLLGLVAEQAVEISTEVSPWLQEHLESSASGEVEIPSWMPFADKLELYRGDITAKLAEFAASVGGFLAVSLAKVSQGTVVFFLDLFVMLYAMYYFLTSGPALAQTFMDYAPLSQSDKEKMLAVGLSVSRATIKGTLIIGMIQGALGGVGFAFVGIDSVVFWGAIMAVLSVVPGIGAALIWAPAVGFLLVSGQTVAAVALLVWSAGVVGSVDNFLRPMLVGRDTEMPDLLILLSTLGGLTLFGAAGLVLGPVLAALFLTVLAIYSTVFADWLVLDEALVGRENVVARENEAPTKE